MVLVKFLGIIDLICALLAITYTFMPKFMIIFVYALFAKGLIFGLSGDAFSWFDVFAGIFLYCALKEIFAFVFLMRVIMFVLFLKGAASMLNS